VACSPPATHACVGSAAFFFPTIDEPPFVWKAILNAMRRAPRFRRTFFSTNSNLCRPPFFSFLGSCQTFPFTNDWSFVRSPKEKLQEILCGESPLLALPIGAFLATLYIWSYPFVVVEIFSKGPVLQVMAIELKRFSPYSGVNLPFSFDPPLF